MPFLKGGHCGRRGRCHVSLEGVKEVARDSESIGEGDKQVEAAKILSLSYRQIQRCGQRVKVEGDKGIVHKSRGRASNRRLGEKVKERVIKLYRKRYKGFGPTLASEKLLEIEGLQVSDETLRQWLLESGDWKKVRKKRVHRQWRERKEHVGEMVQMDGSHHEWLKAAGRNVF